MTQERLRSKVLWMGVISLVMMIMGNYGLYDYIGMTSDVFKSVADLVLGLLVIVGVVNNPKDGENW